MPLHSIRATLQKFRWLVVVAILTLAACQKKQAARQRTSPSVERRAVLAAIGECTAATYREADALLHALQVAAHAAVSEPSAEKRALARVAWFEAMEKWQQAEVMQFGPAAGPSSPGGKDLRNAIYSWPLTSRCLVEQQLVMQGYESPEFTTALVNVRGLDAAEYLLFYEGTDNGCGESATINANGSWAALSVEELAARKARYAAVALDDVVESSSKLIAAWDPAQGNFAGELAKAGQSGAIYESDLVALNAVSDAIFYLEREVKDLKLGRPLGVTECTTGVCPEFLESRFARRSKQHIRNNLLGFGKLFLGCGPNGEGKGLDDLLIAAEAGDLAERMTLALSGAIAAVDAIEEEDLAQALIDDVASVKALYEALKALTDPLKTEFVTALTLELPPLVQGDND